MKISMRLALGFGLAIAAPALAETGASAVQQQLAAVPAKAASDLSDVLGRSVDRARTAAAASSAPPAAVELDVAGALEADIIESAATAQVVQQALGLTLAAQRCVVVDGQEGIWSRTGCAAIADLLTTVTTALGGPAAAGPTGGIAGVAGNAPPVSAAGSDYAED